MSKEATNATHVPYEEFSRNLTDFFNRIIRDHETLVVESDGGEGVLLKPVHISKARKILRRKRTAADHEAFLSSFGGWSDLDDEALIKNIYESRSMPSRPPVEL